MQNNIRLAIHAIFGGAIGFFASIIFLALYYGTVYDMPVTDAFRLKSAIIITALIVIVIFAILFYRDVARVMTKYLGDAEDESE